MLREEQIDLRRQRGRTTRLVFRNLGPHRVFSKYSVCNPASGGEYTVQIRGFDTGDNTCTCPDFKANTLGTCKHIEFVLEHLRDEQPAQVRTKKAVLKQTEIYLHYGDALRLGIHATTRHSDQLAKLIQRFFDEKGLWSGRGRYEDLIPAVEAVPEEITVLSDAMEFLDREMDRHALLDREKELVAALDAEKFTDDLLTVPLYDYQLRGALFLACRGRSILGDDMGLGKTVQTLAAVELLVRERNVARVLVIAPASVKYQWESEIRKYTQRAVQVLEGDRDDRLEQHQATTFYRLANYEQVIRDLELFNAWQPDVIVLDEAQRIRNWESKTSQAVKKLRSRYAMVLTGTPLENRLEELYSIVQFVDQRRFGPVFQFLHDHRVLDDEGNLKAYRNLDAIRDRLAPIFLRRTRRDVLGQLPARTDSTAMVELAAEQRVIYDEQSTALARLLGKGYFSDLDRKRILACLVNLRMVCGSTYLVDKSTHLSPKLDEFAELMPEFLEGGGHKMVVFSQWETMLHEAAAVLQKKRIEFVMLHGSLNAADRKAVLERFRTDASCRVFLSTDAGGTGLNLQMADTVINLELPWNPATLEQRIARVHRLGQSRPVRVVNFVTRGTIEEKVQAALVRKRNLFDGLFAGDEDEVAFATTAPANVANAVKALLADSPEEPAGVPPVDASPLIAATVTLMEALATFLSRAAISDADAKSLLSVQRKLDVIARPNRRET